MTIEIPVPWPVEINLSRLALKHLLELSYGCGQLLPRDIQCEIDNFRNLLQNLIERSEPETENSDLIGG